MPKKKLEAVATSRGLELVEALRALRRDAKYPPDVEFHGNWTAWRSGASCFLGGVFLTNIYRRQDCVDGWDAGFAWAEREWAKRVAPILAAIEQNERAMVPAMPTEKALAIMALYSAHVLASFTGGDSPPALATYSLREIVEAKAIVEALNAEESKNGYRTIYVVPDDEMIAVLYVACRIENGAALVAIETMAVAHA
jgi:hypothetical protein